MAITPIIGLEVHVELKTKTKMFCGCSNEHFHVDPNTHTCPVCLGLPGALPVPNQTAIDYCLKIGLALNCSVNPHSFFERKNYFYPDLPKGYQISQYQQPFCVHGQIDLNGHIVRINRVHLEEDAGKSIHLSLHGEDLTLLDYNRSGVPLVEIVSEPDLQNGEEAKDYLNLIQQTIRYLGVSDADIEKGSMRCEPTINLDIDGRRTSLVEIKNVASLTGVLNAINYEIDRQSQNPEFGGQKTTRGWDADKGETFLQREKEGSADYRYFPEPDIPPFEFSSEYIAKIRASLPELPDQKIHRYQQQYGLSLYDSQLIAANSDYAIDFDSILEFIKNKPIDIPKFAKFTANLFNGPIKTYLNQTQKNISELRLGPKYFWELYNAVEKSQISLSVARQLVVESYTTEKSPLDLAKEKNLLQISDSSTIENLAKQVIAANPKAVADYQKNPSSIGFFIGQVMKLSSGSANPQLAKEILEKLLKND
jgi:aspartyl-tRNA(Asn)/glutamyl-tRNA(Gln) amidotransferase subunit B